MDKFIVGLTGMSGSGKSTVARVLENLGAYIIDADEIIRWEMNPGERLYNKIKETWGEEYITEDGFVNRRKLGKKVFRDTELRMELESISHPIVLDSINEETRWADSDVVVWDAPLLIKTGLYKEVNSVWVVVAPFEDLVSRITCRDAISVKDALNRLAVQIPQEEQINYADVVLTNDGGNEKLETDVKKAWEESIISKIEKKKGGEE